MRKENGSPQRRGDRETESFSPPVIPAKAATQSCSRDSGRQLRIDKYNNLLPPRLPVSAVRLAFSFPVAGGAE